LGEQVGISIGAATFVTSVAILLAWFWLDERPGLGTLANAVVIAVAIDAMRPVLPQPGAVVLQVGQVLVGIGCIGVGSGLYLTCNVGPGPRDGLMTGLHRVLDQPVARVRFAIEVCAVAAGWALGGTVGAGTVMFALLVGYAVSLGLAATGFGRPMK
ncbi:MAG: rane protein, partial [Solirubrobacterales bacterium]|nr:rane protein [Solirubrobacterales bacterium]